MRDVLFDFEGQVSAAGDRGGEFNVQGRLEEGTSCYEGVVFSVFPADVDVIFFHSGYEVSGQGQAQVVRGHSFGVYYGDVGGEACLKEFQDGLPAAFLPERKAWLEAGVLAARAAPGQMFFQVDVTEDTDLGSC